jgi:dTDP-glucose pyrophosphorylase
MSISKAIILAAGRGTRMKSLTEDRPKPMLRVDGRPLLSHVIERMEEAGVRQVLVVTGYRAELVEEYFGEHPPARAGISYRLQQPQNGTGSAALLGREFAATDPVLMTFGDILVASQIYRDLAGGLDGAEAVLALKEVDDPYQGAAVYTEGERVTRIIEKPPQGTSTTRWNNAGIFACRASIFTELERVPLSARGEYELTDAIHQLLAGGHVLHWREIKGFWRDIGRPEDLPVAEEHLAGNQ